MAYTSVSAYIARNLLIQFNSTRIDGVQTLSGLTPTGVSPDIDITDFSQNARVFAVGLNDPGTTTMTAAIDPSTPAYEVLRQSSNDGTEHQLRVVFGKAGPEGYTDGKGFQTASIADANVTTANVSGASTATIAASAASSLPAIKAGHYLGLGSTPTYVRISSIAAGTGGSVVITTAADTLNADSQPVLIVKPAFEVVRQARVQEMTHDANLDSAFMLNLTFRNSGEGQVNVGSPAITI